MKYFLGIDAGGSKTYALVVNEDFEIVGKGRAGNGNHQVNLEEARRNVDIATSQAIAEAGITKEQLTYSCFGLAGADRERDYDILHKMFDEMGFTSYSVTGDVMIGLRAGTLKSYGISIICGTGTNCAGKNAIGQIYQCGGFTYAMGDYGGGGSLKVEAFRSVIRAWDGREEETILTELVLKELNYSNVEEMYNDYLDHDRQIPLHLTKLLFEAAERGDAVSQKILHGQAEELSKQALSVIKHLNMEHDCFDVVLAGSVLTKTNEKFINAYIKEQILKVAPRATVKKLTTEPVIGAILAAYEAAGVVVTSEIYQSLSQYQTFEEILLGGVMK